MQLFGLLSYDAAAFGTTVLATGLIYVLALVIYRLFLSPLSSFPGPRLAATTSLYAMYHDIVRGGQYIWVIEEMHKRYGPIVRIRPDSIHVNDPNLIDQVQGTSTDRRDKSTLACFMMTSPGTFIATPESDLHRKRRAIVSSFFSKQSIRRIEPLLQDTTRKILNRLSKQVALGSPIRTNLLFKAATSEVISQYAFNQPSNRLDKEDLDEKFFTPLANAPKMCHVVSYFPRLGEILLRMHPRLILWLTPEMKPVVEYFSALEAKIESVKNRKEHDTNESPTVIKAMLDPKLPENERATWRVFNECRVIFGAAAPTTAASLASAVFHLLSDTKTLRKLKVELEAAIPDVSEIPTLQQVENLPYLTAVIQETLRLNPPAVMRQEKVAPNQDLRMVASDGRAYIVPRGTAMSMTALLLNRIEELYPSPSEFRPERYIENPQLEKYSLVFSKGPRQCPGINLAYAQLYLDLAAIFRKYDRYDGSGKQTGPTFELFETVREDIDTASDFNETFPRAESCGVRVIIR